MRTQRNMSEAVRAFRYKIVKGALELNDGNVTRAARFTGMPKSTFDRWVSILDLAEYARKLRWDRRFHLARLPAGRLPRLLLILCVFLSGATCGGHRRQLKQSITKVMVDARMGL